MSPFSMWAIWLGVWHLEASKFWTDLADKLVTDDGDEEAEED